MMLARRHHLLAALVLLCAGCAGSLPQHLDPPGVQLRAIELTRLDLSGQSFLLTLDVSNPNPVPIPVDGLELDLDVGGRRLAEARSASTVTIPAGGASLVDVAAATSLLGAAGPLASLAQGQAIDYGLTGSTLIGGLFRVRLPFAETGRLRLVRSGAGLRLERTRD